MILLTDGIHKKAVDVLEGSRFLTVPIKPHNGPPSEVVFKETGGYQWRVPIYMQIAGPTLPASWWV